MIKKTIELTWKHEIKLVGAGQVWAILRQDDNKLSPTFGKWSAEADGRLFSNGSTTFLFDTADVAKAFVEKEQKRTNATM